MAFPFVSNFDFSCFFFFWGGEGGGGLKEQKLVQNEKKNLPVVLGISGAITSYDCHLCYISVKWWYLQTIFHLFKILIFRVVRGVRPENSSKWQKILSVALHIWGTIHHITTAIYVCKMTISLCVFFIFLKI